MCWEDCSGCLPDGILPTNVVLHTALGILYCDFWFRLDLVPYFFIHHSSFDYHLAIFKSLNYKDRFLFKRKPATLVGSFFYLPCALIESGPQAALISIRGFKDKHGMQWERCFSSLNITFQTTFFSC